jgi:hypothetical protein
MTRNRLYVIILIACFFGTLYFLYHSTLANSTDLSVCLIKNVTGYPCPSCGTTRAMMLLSKGALLESLQQNPFGILVAFSMLILPFWIVYDVLKKTDTFYQFYLKAEAEIRKPKIALILILLVILNWIWNLYKHL